MLFFFFRSSLAILFSPACLLLGHLPPSATRFWYQQSWAAPDLLILFSLLTPAPLRNKPEREFRFHPQKSVLKLSCFPSNRSSFACNQGTVTKSPFFGQCPTTNIHQTLPDHRAAPERRLLPTYLPPVSPVSPHNKAQKMVTLRGGRTQIRHNLTKWHTGGRTHK